METDIDLSKKPFKSRPDDTIEDFDRKRVHNRPEPMTEPPDCRPQTEIKLESLTVMNLKPDDILVFKADVKGISHKDLDDYREHFLKYTGLKNKIIFIDKTDDISAIRTKKAAG